SEAGPASPEEALQNPNDRACVRAESQLPSFPPAATPWHCACAAGKVEQQASSSEHDGPRAAASVGVIASAWDAPSPCSPPSGAVVASGDAVVASPPPVTPESWLAPASTPAVASVELDSPQRTSIRNKAGHRAERERLRMAATYALRDR